MRWCGVWGCGCTCVVLVSGRTQTFATTHSTQPLPSLDSGESLQLGGDDVTRPPHSQRAWQYNSATRHQPAKQRVTRPSTHTKASHTADLASQRRHNPKFGRSKRAVSSPRGRIPALAQRNHNQTACTADRECTCSRAALALATRCGRGEILTRAESDESARPALRSIRHASYAMQLGCAARQSQGCTVGCMRPGSAGLCPAAFGAAGPLTASSRQQPHNITAVLRTQTRQHDSGDYDSSRPQLLGCSCSSGRCARHDSIMLPSIRAVGRRLAGAAAARMLLLLLLLLATSSLVIPLVTAARWAVGRSAVARLACVRACERIVCCSCVHASSRLCPPSQPFLQADAPAAGPAAAQPARRGHQHERQQQARREAAAAPPS